MLNLCKAYLCTSIYHTQLNQFITYLADLTTHFADPVSTLYKPRITSMQVLKSHHSIIISLFPVNALLT
jgi:hypothetical protein